MAGHKPLVSIGMPVYNGAHYIREALDSLLAQDYPNFELIISDNASTDETQEICQGYAARDARISYHRAEQNMGAVWNYNRVFELSRGEFFMWSAHDDTRAPTYVSRCLDCLMSNQEAVLCHTQIGIIDENSQLLRVYDTPLAAPFLCPRKRLRALLTHLYWTYVTYGLIRVEAARKTRLLQNYYGTDGGFVIELALYGQILQIPEVLFRYRIGSQELALNQYVARTIAKLDPSNRYRRIRFLRVVLGMHHARSILRAPLPLPSRVVLLGDLIRYYGWHPETVNEFRRLAAVVLGQRRTQLLIRWIRPVWRRLRPRNMG